MSRRAATLFAPFVLLLSSVANDAHAGARAYWVSFVDASESGEDAEAEALLRELLGCGDTPTAECRAAHSPEQYNRLEGVRLYELPGTLSAERAAAAIRSGSARRELRSSLQEAQLWLDGIIVFQRQGNRVTLTYMNGEGQPMGRASGVLRRGALSERHRARMIRAMMQHVERNFDP